MFGLRQDPQPPAEQSQMVSVTQTREFIPKGTASLVDWIKAIVRSVYPKKGDCPTPSVNAKWSTPDETADVLHAQAMWNWLLVTEIFTC